VGRRSPKQGRSRAGNRKRKIGKGLQKKKRLEKGDFEGVSLTQGAVRDDKEWKIRH